MWHRNGGPALVRAVLDAADDPAAFDIPERLDGSPLAPRLDRILASWRKHGSPELVAAIDRHRAAILALPGRSLHEILTSRASAA